MEGVLGAMAEGIPSRGAELQSKASVSNGSRGLVRAGENGAASPVPAAVEDGVDIRPPCQR